MTACSSETVYTIDKKGNVTVSYYYYLTQEEYDYYQENKSNDDDSSVKVLNQCVYEGTKTIDETLYYVYSSQGSYEDATNLVVDKGDFVMTYNSLTSDYNSDDSSGFSRLIVNFPNKVLATNGTLSSNKKTVTFDLYSVDEGDTLYAYTKYATQAISLSNVNYVYTYDLEGNMSETDYISTNKLKLEAPEKITSVEVNGKKLTVKNAKKATVNLNNVKDGKLKITVKTKNFTSKYTVIKDTKAPTIKGVKNGKTYKKSVTFTITDSSGVDFSESKINDRALLFSSYKSIDNGYEVTLSDKGKYTVEVVDERGNSKKIKFTIK
jgi:hypothetical protein